MTAQSAKLAKRTKKKTKKQKDAKVKNKSKVKKNKEIGAGREKKTNPEVVTSQEKELIPIEELERKVRQYIVGQDAQVKQIISAIYRAKIFSSIKANVLIIGNSGTGKTATIKKVAELLGIPYTIEDATKYTQEGYYGADVEEMIYNLIQNADGDFIEASTGMIIIDEIDKKALNGEEHNPAGTEVLNSLLKIIEGTTMMICPSPFMDEPIPFSTEGLTIIFMGAFPGLDKIRDARLNRNAFGFSRNEVKSSGECRYIKQDLVRYGLPEEFAGRVDTIIEMNQLSVPELTKILTDSKLSIFRRYEKEFRRFGIRLKYDNEIFEKIANKALEVKTGARELSTVVNWMFEDVVFEVFAKPGKYKECLLLPGIVEDNTEYLLS